MLPIDFPEKNRVYTKPPSMSDEECSSISAYQGTNANGVPYINTLWMPSKEDLDNLKAGRPIMLSIYSHFMIPVALCTLNEVGEIEE